MRPNKLIRSGIAAFLTAAAIFAAPDLPVLNSSVAEVSAAAAKLAAPANIKAAAENNSIILTWDIVKGADAYRVYMYDETSGKYKTYKNVSKTKCVVSDLKKNTSYKFMVASMLKGGSKYYVHNKSDVVTAKTTNVKLPSAPSKNYTGFASSGGKKYYFENGKAVCGTTVKIDGKLYLFGSSGVLAGKGIHTVGGNEYYADSNGVVKCSQWISFPDSVYYYANSKGKLTQYSLSSAGRTAGFLRIDGKNVVPKDLPMYGKTSARGAYFRVGTDYFRIYLMATGVYAAAGEDALFANAPVYDIRTGKQIAVFCGYPYMDETFTIGSGSKLYDSASGTVWTFSGNGQKPTAAAAGDIVVVRKSLYTNYSKKTDLEIEYYNNTGKTITNIIFTIYGIDSSGNKIRYQANTEYNKYLQDSSRLDNRKGTAKEWWSVMDSEGLKDLVIAGAEVTFADGTKKQIPSDRLTQICR